MNQLPGTSEFKPGDVLRYSPVDNWCHDGQARVGEDGVARDTYWSHDAKRLRPEELDSASLVFNVNDYAALPSHSSDRWKTYHPDDRQILRSQHGCYVTLYVRKGATPDLSTQIENAREAVTDAEREVDSAERSLGWARQKLTELEEASHVPSDSSYIVLVREHDYDDGSPSGEWWKKGEYQADSPEQALRQAWADTYGSPERNGSRMRRYRCAVVAPEIGWREYDVEVKAVPSIVAVREPASSRTHQGEPS